LNDLVSVIITNYNYGNYVADAIESVIAQDYKALEIIVVDDGSTDNSIKIISSYLPNVNLVKKENGGVSSARNFGIAHATGKYIAYLDADDFWEPNKISKQMFVLLDSKSQLNYCGIKFIDVIREEVTFSKENRTGNFNEFFTHNPSRTPFPPSSVLMSMDLVKLVGEWDINLKFAAEDWDYFRRAAKFSDFSYTNENLLTHREHSRSLTSGPKRLYFRDNHSAFLKMLQAERGSTDIKEQQKLIRIFLWEYIKSFAKLGDFWAIYVLIKTLIWQKKSFYEIQL
jgi:glycosyltransferase involved in cell wall biosynthesis